MGRWVVNYCCICVVVIGKVVRVCMFVVLCLGLIMMLNVMFSVVLVNICRCILMVRLFKVGSMELLIEFLIGMYV